jgi:hypothetical protein
MIKKINFLFALLAFVLLKAQTGGQNFTSSPYSNFGLGEQLASHYLQIGSGFSTRSTAYSYSTFNPATLGNVKFTTMDFGLSASSGNVEAGNQKSSFNGGGFNYLGLGLKLMHKDYVRLVLDSNNKPIPKKVFNLNLNAYASLRPMSSVGYNYSLQSTNPIPSTIAHSGSGGLNLAEAGLGMKVNNWFSLGYSAGYVFGGLSDASIFSVNDSLGYQFVSDLSSRDVRGMKHNFGLLKKIVKDSSTHCFGFNYGFYTGVFNKTQRLTTSIIVDNFGLTYIGDTIKNDNNGYQKSELPVYFGLGYSFQWRNKWLFQFNYAQQNWKDIGVTNAYANRKEYGLGFLLNPNDEKEKNAKRMPLQVRVGYRYVSSENNVRSNGVFNIIEENHAYLGFGIPIVRRYFDNTRVRSMINIDFGYLQRGSLDNNLANEQYITARVGFNLGDIWFQKRKFN